MKFYTACNLLNKSNCFYLINFSKKIKQQQTAKKKVVPPPSHAENIVAILFKNGTQKKSFKRKYILLTTIWNGRGKKIKLKNK